MVGLEESFYIAIGIFLYSMGTLNLYITFITVTSLFDTLDGGRVIGYKRIKVEAGSPPEKM